MSTAVDRRRNQDATDNPDPDVVLSGGHSYHDWVWWFYSQGGHVDVWRNARDYAENHDYPGRFQSRK